MAVKGTCKCGNSLRMFGDDGEGNCRICSPREVEQKQVAGVSELSRREGMPTLKEKPVKKKASKKKASKKKASKKK